MSTQVTINKPIIKEDSYVYDFDNYTLNVSGSAKNGQRRARIEVPIKNKNGDLIDTYTLVLAGKEFNEFWENFDSDQIVASMLVRFRNETADVSGIPVSIVNVIK